MFKIATPRLFEPTPFRPSINALTFRLVPAARNQVEHALLDFDVVLFGQVLLGAALIESRVDLVLEELGFERIDNLEKCKGLTAAADLH